MITRPNTKQFVQIWQNNDLLGELAKLDPINRQLTPIVAVNSNNPRSNIFSNYTNLLLSTILLRQNALKGQKTKLFWVDSQLNNQTITSKNLIETGLLHDPETILKTTDYEYLKYVWKSVGGLYQNNIINDEDQIQGYDASTQTWLSNQQVKYEKRSNLVAVVKFVVTTQAKTRLLTRVIEQVNFEIDTQNTLQKEIQLKISKTKTSTVFHSLFNSVPNIDDKSKDDLGLSNVEKDFQDQLLVVKSNIETLKELKSRLDPDNTMSILTWINQPWLLPANSALLVNAEAEYTLFFSKLTKELYLVSESRAIEILKLILDSSQTHIAPELAEELAALIKNGGDSGDYFDKLDLGLFKLVSFHGQDLQGLEYEPIFEPANSNSNSTNDPNYLNAYKIYIQNDIKDDIGTGIYSLTPAFNAFDYIVATKYNLPIIEHLNKAGQVEASKFKNLDSLANINFLDSSNLIIGNLDKKGRLFATFEHEYKVPIRVGSENRIYFGINKAKYVNPEFWERALEETEARIIQNREDKFIISSLIDRKHRLIDTMQPGLPLPIWKPLNNTLPNIVIDSFEQVLKYATNPIHKLINYRELNQSLYLEEKIVIATDKFAKLPLGLNAIQFRSVALSELHRHKFADATQANPVFQDLFVEIQELFTKYEHVQVILEPTEQALLTEWLLELPPGSNQIVAVFYFYQPIDLIDNKVSLQNHIRLLDWSKTSLEEIVIQDEVGNHYTSLPQNLLPSLGTNGLVSYIGNQAYFDSCNQLEVVVSQEDVSELISSLGVFGLQKDLYLHTTGKVQAESNCTTFTDILPLITEFGQDTMALYLAQNGVLESQDCSFDTRQLAKVAKQVDGIVEQFLFWYQLCLEKQPLPTLILSAKYKKLINRWWHAYTTSAVVNLQQHIEKRKWQNAANRIIEYFEVLNNWYLPRAKKLYPASTQEVTVCVADTLQAFIYQAQIIIPFNCEKIHTVINQNRLRFEPLIFSKAPTVLAVSTVQQDILDKIENLNTLIEEVQGIRQMQKIRLRQPLYVDLNKCELEQEYIDILINDCNLIPKNLLSIEGEIAQLEGYYGALVIDLVIDENLANLGFGRDFERAVQDFRKHQGYKHNEIIRLSWQLDSDSQWELVQKVIKNISWHKLNLEITWVENQDTTNAKKLEVKDLCTIWVWEKE